MVWEVSARHRLQWSMPIAISENTSSYSGSKPPLGLFSIADFVALAKLLQLPRMEEQDQEDAVAAVRHWLTLHTGWLLIYANADDLTMVFEFLPAGDTGHILLTTCTQATGGLANSIEVEKMDQQEGTLLSASEGEGDRNRCYTRSSLRKQSYRSRCYCDGDGWAPSGS